MKNPGGSSKESKWHIGKDRRLELIHFVRQYPIWMSSITDLNLYSATLIDERIQKARSLSLTDRLTTSVAFYEARINLVNRAAAMTDKVMVKPILWHVIYNESYDELSTRFVIQCSKNVFYEKIREFLWNLDKLRM